MATGKYGHCLSCGVDLGCIDEDPNGDKNATCAQCRAEEEHDFDADPSARFDRFGHRIYPKVAAALPMQPIVRIDGVARFKENQIVRWLLDRGDENMNTIACMNFSDEDRTQFAQLIGYSVSGAGDLDYFDRDVLAKADEIVACSNPATPTT